MSPRTISTISTVVALALLTVACNGDGNAATTSTVPVPSTSPSTSAAPSTTSRPTTPTSTEPPASTSSQAPSTAPATPSVETTPTTTAAIGETDWRSIIETLGQRRQDLYAAPDIVRIPEVCGDATPCSEQLNVQIGDLATKGWRVDGADPFVVVDARVDEFDGETLEGSVLVTVVAVIQRLNDAGTIVDSAGATVAAVEPDTEPGFNAQGRFLLGRVGPPEDPWRLISQDTLPEVPA